MCLDTLNQTVTLTILFRDSVHLNETRPEEQIQNLSLLQHISRIPSFTPLPEQNP